MGKLFFAAVQWETIAKTSVCRAGPLVVLWRSACWAHQWGLRVQELHPSLLCRQVFSHASLPRLAFTAGSLQLLRLNYRYDTELCFSSGVFLRCLKPGELAEVHTKGFQGAFNGNQIFFSQKCVTFGCTFYFTKIKVELSTFLRRWRMCLSFWNCILLHFLFSNAHNVNYSIWLSWRQWQNPRFLIQNKEKFKLNILLCFHFEAQIHGKLKNLKL